MPIHVVRIISARGNQLGPAIPLAEDDRLMLDGEAYQAPPIDLLTETARLRKALDEIGNYMSDITEAVPEAVDIAHIITRIVRKALRQPSPPSGRIQSLQLQNP